MLCAHPRPQCLKETLSLDLLCGTFFFPHSVGSLLYLSLYVLVQRPLVNTFRNSLLNTGVS